MKKNFKSKFKRQREDDFRYSRKHHIEELVKKSLDEEVKRVKSLGSSN